jgi:anti-sigma factor RsiW
MNCRDFLEFVDDFLAGNLPESERAHFEQHLGECPHCVEYLASYRETVSLGTAAYAPDSTVPADVPEDLIKAILSTRGR